MNSCEEDDIEPLHTFEWPPDPCMAIVQALSTVLERKPTKIEPLYETTNPDQLTALLTSGNISPDASIEFEHQGYSIVIHANGRGYIYSKP